MEDMKVRFTKIDPTRHRFEIVRSNRASEQALLETKSLMPHDLIHFAYESAAGRRESFFGKLASGTTLEEFNDRAIMSDPKNLGAEMITTERITGPLSAYLLEQIDERTFFLGLKNAFDATGDAVPADVTPDLLLAIKARYRSLIGEWNSLPHHKTMEIEWIEGFWA